MSNKILSLLLLAMLVMTACSKDDDNNTGSTPAPASEQGAPVQMLVVFDCNQLGDKGYADDVMTGIYQLKKLDQMLGGDSLDVQFIASNSIDAHKALTRQWLQDTTNPFYRSSYKRRLLVLTENFMTAWLTDFRDLFQPTDEVLLLKVNADDVAAAAQASALGSRVHGLNISAAWSAHRFCQVVKQRKREAEAVGKSFNIDFVPIFRLYAPSVVSYRDSIEEVMTSELGTTATNAHIYLSRKAGESAYSVEEQTSYLQLAYRQCLSMQAYHEELDVNFCVTDLGSASAGFDYFLMSDHSNAFSTLMLDATPIEGLTSRMCIRRRFGTALVTWATQWLATPAAMPAFTSHNHDDGYQDDNLDEYLNTDAEETSEVRR